MKRRPRVWVWVRVRVKVKVWKGGKGKTDERLEFRELAGLVSDPLKIRQ